MSNRLIKLLSETAKSFVFRYTRWGKPNYPYNVEPIQLALLINEIERLKTLPGSILEVGVARGMTTRFIAQHLAGQRSENHVKLYAVDTFSSFTESDLEFEVKKRGKSLLDLRGFTYNDYAAWSRNFADFPFVEAIKGDCSTLDYSKFSPIKLAFLDVDLYLPTLNALPAIYENLVPGGVILVDDVFNNSTYDGAYQAYMEFCSKNNIAPSVVGTKCGVLRK